MSPQTHFQQTEQELMNMKFDSLTEQKILKHWRVYEPKRVEQLLSQGVLKKTLVQTADALFDLQRRLEKTENLNPALAQSEAWSQMMRSEEDAAEEAKAWGMTLEDYLNRP